MSTASVPVLAAIAAGAVAGGGVLLLVVALTGSGPAAPERVPWSRQRALRDWRGRFPIALGLAVLTLLITRWPVAALAAGGLGLLWPSLVGGARAERKAAARLEGLAIWTESLRDTIAGAVGLEQAIIATSQAAPASIGAELTELADRIRVRVPLVQALHRLADELDDPVADLVVAALLLNSRLRGPGLRQVLSSLADSTRAELEMRGRVTAGRASTRRSVQIVVTVTVLFVLVLVLFNPEYVAPYGTPVGQVVLLVVLGLFAAGFLWLRRLAGYDLPGRFLLVRAGPGGGRS